MPAVFGLGTGEESGGRVALLLSSQRPNGLWRTGTESGDRAELPSYNGSTVFRSPQLCWWRKCGRAELLPAPQDPHSIWPFLWVRAGMGEESLPRAGKPPACRAPRGRPEVKHPFSWQMQPSPGCWACAQPEPPSSAAGPHRKQGQSPLWCLGLVGGNTE